MNSINLSSTLNTVKVISTFLAFSPTGCEEESMMIPNNSKDVGEFYL